MISSWKSALLCGSAIVVAAGSGFAQTPPASQVSRSQAPLYDPQQFPATTGEVQHFTLTPRGDIDGFILADGTEIKTPPHLSTALAYAVKRGDTVTVHGLRAAALPLVQAVSVTDEASGATVVDNGGPRPGRGPAPPPPPPPGAPDPAVAPPNPASMAPLPGLTEAQGKIRMTLHGPAGDVNGALLEDGTALRLPPPEAARFAALLQPGQDLVAEGTVLSNPLGTVMEVRQLGASRDQLSEIRGPGPGGPRGRRGPPPA